jgi:hypothetical protein
VSTLQPIPYRDPADLLRRFAPTPLRARIDLESAGVVMETNDLSLLPPSYVVDVTIPLPSSRSCLWKIIRDVDVRGTTAEASIIMAGSLIVYTMGPACLIGADRERNEILAFIGRDVDKACFHRSILPALQRLTEFVTRKQKPSTVVENAEAAIGGHCGA